jgi:hypothetical protein
MFLQQVYKHSKWLFVLFVAFMVAQLFINYKHGMVATPFLHYGMYSQRMQVQPSYGVFEVRVNGIMLQGKDYSAQEWDKIILPLRYYGNTKASNQLYVSEINRLMNAVHLTPQQERFVQQCNAEEFLNWYSRYLATIIHAPVQQLDVRYRTYIYNEKQLVPTGTVLSLPQLCS